MRLELVIDGERHRVEVDLAGRTVTVGTHRFPLAIAPTEGERVELEIDGVRVVVEGWAPNNDRPTARLSVNGESVEVERWATVAGSPPTGREPPSPGPAATPSPSAAPVASSPAEGIPLRPPMPGKLLEVRVKEGDAVSVGQVLLVLEAMKMRNELASPATGTVTALAASPGASVRANDVLLRVRPPSRPTP
jgi:glutaconyl-CoA/methylmalonyl-CoA decarboxylase subunit gamma